MSNSSRENELAGATTAMLVSRAQAWWFQHSDQANCDIRSEIARCSSEPIIWRSRAAVGGRHSRRKPLLRPAVALERGFHLLQRQPLVLDRVDQGLQCLSLKADVHRRCRCRT